MSEPDDLAAPLPDPAHHEPGEEAEPPGLVYPPPPGPPTELPAPPIPEGADPPVPPAVEAPTGGEPT